MVNHMKWLLEKNHLDYSVYSWFRYEIELTRYVAYQILQLSKRFLRDRKKG